MKRKTTITTVLLFCLLIPGSCSTTQPSNTENCDGPFLSFYTVEFCAISSFYLAAPVLLHNTPVNYKQIFTQDRTVLGANSHISIQKSGTTTTINYSLSKVYYKNHIIDNYTGTLKIELNGSGTKEILNHIDTIEISNERIDFIKLDSYKKTITDMKDVHCNLRIIMNDFPLGTKGSLLNNKLFRKATLSRVQGSTIEYKKLPLKQFLENLNSEK